MRATVRRPRRRRGPARCRRGSRHRAHHRRAGPGRPDQPSHERRLTPMHAQLIEGGTTPAQRDEMNRIVTEELIPALQEEPGFTGALNLANTDSGDGLMVILWETEAQARRALGQYGSAFLRALAGISQISTGVRRPISVWAVNARTT